MADLSNLKIKNTYQNVLQLDSGALQNLLGQTPTLFEVNGNLRYIDGNQQDGYVLKSNAVGDAIWGSVSTGDLYVSAATLDNTILKLHTTSGNTISVPVSYWSTDGNGNYANSGLTGNVGIGTASPSTKLHIVGAETKIEAPSTTDISDYVVPGAGKSYNFYNVRQNSDFVFKQNVGGMVGTNTLILKGDTGNIGVGTTIPNEKLTVVGAISATTDLYFNTINGGTF